MHANYSATQLNIVRRLLRGERMVWTRVANSPQWADVGRPGSRKGRVLFATIEPLVNAGIVSFDRNQYAVVNRTLAEALLAPGSAVMP